MIANATRTDVFRFKCANCRQYHRSFFDIQACCQGIASSTPPARTAERLLHEAPRHQSIFDVKGVNPDGSPRQPRPATPAVPVRSAAAIVADERTALKAAEAKVPEGRYAVDLGGTLKFYVVDKPTEGRWTGYTFVKTQASDETYPVKNPGIRLTILNAIGVDPLAAMLRYGKEIGKCGHCNRTLTNEESRDRGIGPVCWGKLGGLGF